MTFRETVKREQLASKCEREAEKLAIEITAMGQRRAELMQKAQRYRDGSEPLPMRERIDRHDLWHAWSKTPPELFLKVPAGNPMNAAALADACVKRLRNAGRTEEHIAQRVFLRGEDLYLRGSSTDDEHNYDNVTSKPPAPFELTTTLPGESDGV